MRSSFLSLALASLVAAQTTSNCNPLKKTCPADPALGGHADFDFKSKSDRFTSVGGEPSYGDDGATFTIAQKGQAPTLGTKFYIMFGHVDIQMKASPGTGLVSSAILQSDDLDEIDWEWLGGDNGNVQSNYFGKGITGNYDRAAFHPVSNVQGDYHTYGIDWTKDRIQWSIDGNVVRTLTPQDADNGNQYPQSPMNIRIGSWAGGASENQGTVEWAGGATDFSQAPFKMLVKSLAITDYSTGKSYSYSDNSGSWQSIKSDGGKIDGTGKPDEGDNVIDNPSTAEQTGMPHFPDFVPPHPTTHVTHSLIWPWVPAASATATATGNALGGVVVDSGAKSLNGRRTFLTRPGVLVTGVSTQVTTTSSKPKETTHESTTITSTTEPTTTSLPATTTTSATPSTFKTMTIMSTTSSVPVPSTSTIMSTTFSTHKPSTTTIMSTTSPDSVSSTLMTVMSTTSPAPISSTTITNIPITNPSSIIKSTTFVTSQASTTATSTAASATATSSGSKEQGSKDNSSGSASSSAAAAPLNTANAASGHHIPGAAIALGMLAVFA